jgi:hypothetical protein
MHRGMDEKKTEETRKVAKHTRNRKTKLFVFNSSCSVYSTPMAKGITYL